MLPDSQYATERGAQPAEPGCARAAARQRTERGFAFMLQDTYHQLWQLLRAFINLAGASAGGPPGLW